MNTLAGALVSASALGAAWAFSRTRLACLVGLHLPEPDWLDTGEEPDEGGRIYVARHCSRCRREMERVPMARQWSMGGSALYGPER